MTRPLGFALAGAAFAGAVVVAYAFWPGQSAAGLLRPDDTQAVALGQRIYAEHCAACHGENLEGQPDWKSPGPDGKLPAPPHDVSGHTWHHDGETLFQLTKFGLAKLIGDPNYASNMPAYETVLTDEEIIAVLSYIKSTWPQKTRDWHDELERSKQ